MRNETLGRGMRYPTTSFKMRVMTNRNAFSKSSEVSLCGDKLPSSTECFQCSSLSGDLLSQTSDAMPFAPEMQVLTVNVIDISLVLYPNILSVQYGF